MTDSDAGGVVLPVVSQRRDLAEVGRALVPWMAEHLVDASDVALSAIEMPSAAGVANETLMFEATWTANGQARQQGFVARLGSEPQIYLDADVIEHARLYRTIGEVSDVPVPSVLGTEPDASVLGAPFFVMERLPGRVAPDTPPYAETGWVKDLTDDDRRLMWRNGFGQMCALHRIDVEHVSFLERPRRGSSGLEQSLEYWIEMLAACDDGTDLLTLGAGVDWLRAELPTQRPTAFAWGDSRYGNILYEGTEVRAILDWDLASLAGGMTDLAWWILFDHCATLGHGLAPLGGHGTASECLDLWEELTGQQVVDLDFHLAFAAFRMGVSIFKIAQSMVELGILPAEAAGFGVDNVATQSLASITGLRPPGPVCLDWPPVRR